MIDGRDMILDDKRISEMRLFIFGAGNIARATLISLRDNRVLFEEKIEGFVVTSLEGNPREIEGIPVYSIDDMKDMKDVHFIVAVRDVSIPSVISTLTGRGFTDYELVKKEACIDILEKKWINKRQGFALAFKRNFDREHMTDDQYLLFLIKQCKEEVLNFEVNIADHCNLNCKCCNHFSPLAKAHFLDLVQYEKDLIRLRELYGENGIGRVMLLGGEPLLNPAVEDAIRTTRRHIGNGNIYLYTNGLLFPKMSDSFWKTCESERVCIKVTKYPLSFDYGYWEGFIKKSNIGFVDVNEEVSEDEKIIFWMPLKESGGVNVYENYGKCYHANHCVVLRDGRLYTCPNAAWVDYLNDFFHKSFPELNSNSVSIYDAETKEEIDSFLKTPIPLCRYCDIENYEYDLAWGTSRREERESID